MSYTPRVKIKELCVTVIIVFTWVINNLNFLEIFTPHHFIPLTIPCENVWCLKRTSFCVLCSVLYVVLCKLLSYVRWAVVLYKVLFCTRCCFVWDVVLCEVLLCEVLFCVICCFVWYVVLCDMLFCVICCFVWYVVLSDMLLLLIWCEFFFLWHFVFEWDVFLVRCCFKFQVAIVWF